MNKSRIWMKWMSTLTITVAAAACGTTISEPIQVDQNKPTRSPIPPTLLVKDLSPHDAEVWCTWYVDSFAIEEPRPTSKDVIDGYTCRGAFSTVRCGSEPSSLCAAPPWRELASAGRYADAWRRAESEGFDDLCRRASAADLLALADAARFGGGASRAREPLTALRTRFPGTREAGLAGVWLLVRGAGSSGVNPVLFRQRHQERATGRSDLLSYLLQIRHHLAGQGGWPRLSARTPPPRGA